MYVLPGAIMNKCTNHMPDERVTYLREFLQVSVKLWSDQDDPIEQLLNDCILLFSIRVIDSSNLLLGVFVYRILRVRRSSSRLCAVQGLVGHEEGIRGQLTWPSSDLNSSSFCFLYASISFAASVRASFSFCVRSVAR